MAELDKNALILQYQTVVQEYLDKLTARLLPELSAIAVAHHDPQTYLLHFEVEMQDFPRGFPVSWVPMDKEATQLDSDLPPGLLMDLPFTVPEDVFSAPIYEDAEVETWELGYDILVAWFIDCWHRAGGPACPYPAYIAPHDSYFSINMSTRQEINDDEKWPATL